MANQFLCIQQRKSRSRCLLSVPEGTVHLGVLYPRHATVQESVTCLSPCSGMERFSYLSFPKSSFFNVLCLLLAQLDGTSVQHLYLCLASPFMAFLIKKVINILFMARLSRGAWNTENDMKLP